MPARTVLIVLLPLLNNQLEVFPRRKKNEDCNFRSHSIFDGGSEDFELDSY